MEGLQIWQPLVIVPDLSMLLDCFSVLLSDFDSRLNFRSFAFELKSSLLSFDLRFLGNPNVRFMNFFWNSIELAIFQFSHMIYRIFYSVLSKNVL